MSWRRGLLLIGIGMDCGYLLLPMLGNTLRGSLIQGSLV